MPDTRFQFALGLIREAGALAHGYFLRRETLTIAAKGLQDMASEADLQTELLIKRRLAEAWPQDAFLGEETGATAFAPDQGIWVVDPIDGTQPFISGLSSWCVSIAFVQGGVLQFGMVYAPARDELFAGGTAHQPTLNGLTIKPHTATSIRNGITAFGYSPRVPSGVFLPPFNRFIEAGGVFYRDGSGALCLSYVACGRLAGFIEMHINSWDCLGALAVAQAAGLVSNDFLAGDGLTKGNRLIVGPAPVFAELTAIFAGH